MTVDKKTWALVRPGVRMAGTWGPAIFDYPFRFKGPKVGDTVYIIIRHRETKEFRVVEDTIAEVWDNYDNDASRTAPPESPERDNYLIDYGIENFDPGHGLTFGDVLFETREDAQEILDDILANLAKWDGEAKP